MNDKEDILVFYAKQCTYNPQFTKGKPYGANKAGTKHQTECYRKFKKSVEGSDGKRYPKRVIDFGVVGQGTLHPTQKPVPLLEYLIKTYTHEGETVLDNTMGSGSTGVACVNTNRNFIGIEKEEKYFNIAQDRVLKARSNEY